VVGPDELLDESPLVVEAEEAHEAHDDAASRGLHRMPRSSKAARSDRKYSVSPP
jgi:hypothetical protein